MLHHESTPEVLPHPYTSQKASPLTPQETDAVTPQELAQAIVAVEDVQGVSLQSEPGSAVIQQTIAQSGVAVTPDQLLAEVHRQRGQSHQNSAMTPRLTQNLTVRLLIAGVICSSLAAILLLGTSFMFANRFRDASEALAKYVRQDKLKASAPNALQTLQSWKYPGAASLGSGGMANFASADLTTHDEYAKVWKYYADKTDYADKTGHIKEIAGVSYSSANASY